MSLALRRSPLFVAEYDASLMMMPDGVPGTIHFLERAERLYSGTNNGTLTMDVWVVGFGGGVDSTTPAVPLLIL